MSSDINSLLSKSVINFIKNEIDKADGNEVFFSGEINSEGCVISVIVGARGNIHSVPVNPDVKLKGSVLIHNHPGGNLTPSDADLSIAEASAQNAQGFYIINNDVSKIYVVVEPVLPKKIIPLNIESVSSLIENNGPLSKISDSFEERPSQVELLKKIAYSFNNNKIGVFEAGTGVGKSFAYLIPSILWSLQNQEKIIISTGTINLQQQICIKDIPLAIKITGKPVKFLLMKGRQNYICKRRLEDVKNSVELFDDAEMLQKIVEWEAASETGSKSELTFMPNDSLWTKINSESDACMGSRCPFHTQCFVMKVRKEAAGCNILVVNHHLLFADIESRLSGIGYDDASVLPAYRRIIFDEAHGIETAATSFFSESFNRFKIMKQLNLLYKKKKNTQTGFLFTISILSSNEEVAFTAYEKVSKIKNDLISLEMLTLDLLQEENTIWLNKFSARSFQPILSMCKTLAKDISEFSNLVTEVIDGISDDDKDVPSVWETKVINRRLSDYSVVLQDFSMWEEKDKNVFWVQKKMLPREMAKDSASPFYINFTETPLDIAPLMKEGVFEPMNSVICTSATLKTGKDFSYWIRRNGISFIEKNQVLTGEFLSPFPYDKNMIFAVPKDIPFPDESDFQFYVEKVLEKLILNSKGRTLVLFTSYESLINSYNKIYRKISEEGIKLFRQGQDDNSRLLENFKKDISSVLFATDSFWQGVDVPGNSLSQVIIIKLPFTVPNDPVFKARSESIKLRGGNSFMELSVPDAIIKFRQGIGRLIRKSTDSGAVIVLDRRIYEKRYGSLFLENVPNCKKMYDSLENILKESKKYFNE